MIPFIFQILLVVEEFLSCTITSTISSIDFVNRSLFPFLLLRALCHLFPPLSSSPLFPTVFTNLSYFIQIIAEKDNIQSMLSKAQDKLFALENGAEQSSEKIKLLEVGKAAVMQKLEDTVR